MNKVTTTEDKGMDVMYAMYVCVYARMHAQSCMQVCSVYICVVCTEDWILY
jgi:hypothetical protein